MAQFRKKPIVIEAEQFYPEKTPWPKGVYSMDYCSTEEGKWCNIHNKSHIRTSHRISTLEGAHIVTSGDWIITGVKGEHYPCKPDIFYETYEEVTDA